MTATPAKLRDGSWGARVQGHAQTGDRITVTTKTGKTWEATVSAVVWRGDGVTLVATGSASSRSARRGDGGRRGERPCYMCRSYYCEGARGGLCEED